MLTIENKDKLNNEVILRHTTDGYYVEGIVECKDHYQIDIRCSNKTLPSEMLILLRNKVKNENNFTYNYYTLYNSNEPQRRLNITKQMIGFKDMFLFQLEQILKMNN